MTEFEKMVAGQLYDPSNAELVKIRDRVRVLAYEYNASEGNQVELRYNLLDQMLGGHGKNMCFEPTIKFDYGCNTYIGENFFANFDCKILDVATVKIGNDVMFGPSVILATPCHPIIGEQRRMRARPNGEMYDLEFSKPITIGNDVWIGSGAIVCGGVTIGDGSVIGAGSVVTKDIPAGVVAVGNPCRVMRKITEADRLPE